MRQSYRSIAIAFALAAAAASVPGLAQDSPNASPTRRNSGDAFSFGAPMRTQDSIISGNSAFSNPAVTNNLARSGPQTGTSHITPVPEPSQWAMMLAGLALVGFIVRRNNRNKDD